MPFPAAEPCKELVRLARKKLQSRDTDGCLASADQAISLGADPLEVSYERWMCFMLRGDFESAWCETDRTEKARRSQAVSSLHEPIHERRVWDGSSLDGKTVLVRCYHGLGDTIQFVRFIPLLRKRATRVILQCQQALEPLLREFPGVDDLIFLESSAPVAPWETEIEIMELPYALRIRASTIPAQVPYLNVPGELIRAARNRLFAASDKAKTIGLVWGSGDWNLARNIALRKLEQLSEIPGIALFSLQRGEAASQINKCQRLKIADTECESNTIADTAATIMNLDLVISVDTMVAHLAGALGKPVWLLLPFCADWRWMLDRKDSLWYPTMRIFRQKRCGDWREPIEEVMRALKSDFNLLRCSRRQ